MTLVPFFPPRPDELTQGYFARMGHVHALTDVGGFLRYSGVSVSDFRMGTDRFIDQVHELTGADRVTLKRNTLVTFPGTQGLKEGTSAINGNLLSGHIVRRTALNVCPECLINDQRSGWPTGPDQMTLRLPWLFRQVVACPVHRRALKVVRIADSVWGLDIARTIIRAEFNPAHHMHTKEPREVGALQRYVTSRILENERKFPWLDGQTVSQAAKACEMLGCLVADGATADIINYSDADWARVGDVGFEVASQGAEAVLEELTRIRVNSGRTSGRAGPQAVFGKLYTWLGSSALRAQAGPICDIVREAIIANFPVGPGEVIFGEVVKARVVHSANTLINKTGRNRKRFYKLLTKLGYIPDTRDAIATNQFVFPAGEVEQVVERIENSVRLNQVRNILGCSRTNAETLAAAGIVVSVVPMTEGEGVGVTVGAYNRDDLTGLLDDLCARAVVVNDLPATHVGFRRACKRAPCVSLVTWQRQGLLKNTVHVGTERRIDRLGFDVAELRRVILASGTGRKASIPRKSA